MAGRKSLDPVPKHRRRADGELQADILKVLWNSDVALSANDVRDELGTALAYTTVMTVLGRLDAKGLVVRHPQGRGFVYEAAVTRAELIAQQMRDLLSSGDDRTAVLQRFVEALDPSHEQQLRQLLAEANRRAL